jgi:hypothetical protein
VLKALEHAMKLALYFTLQSSARSAQSDPIYHDNLKETGIARHIMVSEGGLGVPVLGEMAKDDDLHNVVGSRNEIVREALSRKDLLIPEQCFR